MYIYVQYTVLPTLTACFCLVSFGASHCIYFLGSAIENDHLQLIFPLKIVIFHIFLYVYQRLSPIFPRFPYVVHIFPLRSEHEYSHLEDPTPLPCCRCQVGCCHVEGIVKSLQQHGYKAWLDRRKIHDFQLLLLKISLNSFKVEIHVFVRIIWIHNVDLYHKYSKNNISNT